MKVIVVGAGTVGMQIAKHLIEEKKDVVLIEKNPVQAKVADNSLDCLVINKPGNNVDALREAGIEKTDFFISVTDSDEINMISCGIVSNDFDVPVKIARIRNAHYAQAKLLASKAMGIDYVVNSELEAAKSVTSTILHGAISEVLLFEQSQVQMRSLNVDQTSPLCGKMLKEIKQTIKGEYLFSGISRGKEFIIPSGDTTVKEHDTIWVIAQKKHIESFFQRVGKPKEELKKVLIAGCGAIGYTVADYLLRFGKKVKIVESSYDRCKELSQTFSDAIVINADITEEKLFEEEQLFNNDLIITTTHNEEMNVLTALYAKSLGVKRAIALVSKTNYLNLSTTLGIDSVVNPKTCTVNRILKFIRRGNIKNIYSIFDGQAEVIEFSVDAHKDICNKPIKKIKMPKDAIILTVNRKEDSLIPDGDFKFQHGDNVITIAKKESISRLEHLFLD